MPQPSKVTIRITRWWPLGFGDDHVDVADSPIVWAPGEGSTARALLSAPGHELEVRLGEVDTEAPSAPPGMVKQPVELVGGADSGTYSGDLELVPGGTNNVAMEAQVRDLFLWPVLLMGLAALLGGLATTWWQRRRRRDILVAELRRARDEYEVALEARPPGSPVDPLDGPFDRQAMSDLESEIASARTAEELEEATERVRAVRSAGRRWIGIEAAAHKLMGADDGTPAKAATVLGDNREVLAGTRFIGDDEKGIAELLAKLRRQERLARAFKRAWDRDEEAARRAYIDGAYTSDATTAASLDALAHLDVDRDTLRAQYDFDDIADDLVFLTALDRRGERPPQAPMAAFVIGVPEVTPLETPAQIQRRVRVWDGRLAIATALATLVAFALTVYDADFGSWEDYVKVLGLGVGGQAIGATVWSLFPALSSYRLPPPKRS